MSTPGKTGRRAWYIVVLVCAGCSRPAVVSGTVTWDGKPLLQGYISFFAEKGNAAAQGTQISEGTFHLTGLPPGKRRVLVSTQPRAVIRNGEARLVVPEAVVPAHAPGNYQAVTITGDDQVLHFRIEKVAVVD